MAEPVTFSGLEVPKHPEADTDFDHADLQFHNVDHSGHSYEVRVYLNNPEATYETGRDEAHGYAGSFHVFGHGGCYGQEGHCDPKGRGDHPFDYRLPHPLEPMMKSLEVTDSLKAHRNRGADDLSVTLVPIRYESSAQYARDATDDIGVDSVSLVTYETTLDH